MLNFLLSTARKVTTSRQRKAVHSVVTRTYEKIYPPPPPPIPPFEMEHMKRSFSAWGEDLVIAAWLSIKQIPLSSVRYLDIGAAYPVFLSNSYFFYREGGSGVLVEPDPNQSANLRKERPRDLVVQAGVTDHVAGQAKLIQMSSPVFNTFSREGADKVVRQSHDWLPSQAQEIVGETSVEMIPINDIIRRHFAENPPHILSLDVEGMEIALLKAMDMSKCQPLAICVECSVPLPEFMSILQPYGYQLVSWTPDNFVFVKV